MTTSYRGMRIRLSSLKTAQHLTNDRINLILIKAEIKMVEEKLRGMMTEMVYEHNRRRYLGC